KVLKALEADQLEAATARSQKVAEEARKRTEVVKSIHEQIEQQRLEISMLGESEAARRSALTMLEAERAGIQQHTAEWFQLRDAVLASNRAYDDATRLAALMADTPTAKLKEQRRDIELLTQALQEYIATGGVSGISPSQYEEAVTARLDLVAE